MPSDRYRYCSPVLVPTSEPAREDSWPLEGGSTEVSQYATPGPREIPCFYWLAMAPRKTVIDALGSW